MTDSLKILNVPSCTRFIPSASAGPVVNDGGLSWLRKSQQRMKEQAEREQRSFKEVVAERYGVRIDGTLASHAFTCTIQHIWLQEKDTELMRTLNIIQFIANLDLKMLLSYTVGSYTHTHTHTQTPSAQCPLLSYFQQCQHLFFQLTALKLSLSEHCVHICVCACVCVCAFFCLCENSAAVAVHLICVSSP